MNPDPTPGEKPWLAISGPAGVGKDAIADVLCSRYGYTRIAFADTLRSMTWALDPIVGVDAALGFVRASDAVEQFGYGEAKSRYPELRRVLQVMGTEVVRQHVDDNFWINDAVRRADEVEGPVVFTDCRFPNEAHAIQKVGGSVCRVECRNLAPVLDHSSETALDDFRFDFYLANPRQENLLLLERQLGYLAGYADTFTRGKISKG